jgi:hypothetical protein
VKFYTTTPIIIQDIGIGLPTSSASTFLDIMPVFYSSYPYLSDVGFAGYGTWSINGPAPLFENFTTAYVQTFALPSSNVSEAVDKFEPVMEKLAHFTSDDLQMSNTQHSYPDYESYFAAKNGTVALVEGIGVCDSRLLDGKSLTSNFKFLRETLTTIAGIPEENAYHNVGLHCGQVFDDAEDPYSAVCPASRKGYVLDIIARTFVGRDEAPVFPDVRDYKMAAMVRLHRILEVI